VRRCNAVARTREGEAAASHRAPHQGSSGARMRGVPGVSPSWPGMAWDDASGRARRARARGPNRPGARSAGSGRKQYNPGRAGSQTAADPSVGRHPRPRISLWHCPQDSPDPCSRWTSCAALLRPVCVFRPMSYWYDTREAFCRDSPLL